MPISVHKRPGTAADANSANHPAPEVLSHLAVPPSKTTWGRPTVRVRGDIAAIPEDVRQIDFTPDVGTAHSRSFDSIPILCFSTAQGLGDLSSAMNLADALRRAYPEKQIELILVDGLTPRPVLAPKLARLQSLGVAVQTLSRPDALALAQSRVVAIQGIIPHTDREGTPFSDQMSAALNIYVPEYDPSIKYCNPTGMGLHQLCTDRSGLLHIALTSGFDEQALGLFLGENTSTPQLATSREDLLSALNIRKGTALWNRVTTSVWTCAYRNGYGLDKERLAQAIAHARARGKLQLPVAILDFTNFDDFSIRQSEKNLTFPSVLDKPSGIYVRPLSYYDENVQCKEIADSVVLRLGRRSSNTFAAALHLAELPVEITGDASLTEAIMLGRPFFYDAPPWKWNLQSRLVEYCTDTLSLKSANVIRSLYLRSLSHDPKRLQDYAAIERLYLAYRKELLTPPSDANEHSDTFKGYEARSRRIKAIVIRELPGARSDQIALSISKALSESNCGLDVKLWTLRRSLLLDTDYRQRDQNSREEFEAEFVSNPALWDPFRELRADVRKNLDFAKNMRTIIDGLVMRHQLLK